MKQVFFNRRPDPNTFFLIVNFQVLHCFTAQFYASLKKDNHSQHTARITALFILFYCPFTQYLTIDV